MPAISFSSLPGARGVRLVERHAVAYRHAWLVFVSGIAEPVFYLLSVGVGIGGLVGTVMGPGGHPVPYREFVPPGLLAVSALNGALYDSTFNIFARMKFAHLYDAVLATPVGAGDVALGEVAWAVFRGLMYALAFMCVMLVMRLVHSWWAVFAVPVACLIAFAVAAVGVACTTYMKSWHDFDYVMLVAMPMFLFSATFFPITVYPPVIAAIVNWSPLYQGVVLLRAFILGAPSPELIWRAAYLAVLGVAGLALAGRRLARLLLV
jgi:lipooligosaccharide transport system permease protein